MTKEEYEKYADTVLTEEQLDELQERYFKYGCYDRDDQTLLIDGSTDPIIILAAADYIRSLDTFKVNYGVEYKKKIYEAVKNVFFGAVSGWDVEIDEDNFEKIVDEELIAVIDQIIEKR